MPVYNRVGSPKPMPLPPPVPAVLKKYGALIEIKFEVHPNVEKYFVDTGKPVPPPVFGNALIDTGASITSVDLDIINALGIAPSDFTHILTPSTSKPIRQEIFTMSLTIVENQLRIDFPNVVGLPLKSQGISALIGRDLLSLCLFVYNGPMGSFSLAL